MNDVETIEPEVQEPQQGGDDGPKLSDPDRDRLAGIVRKMQANGESDENIRTAVGAFKQKYGKLTIAPGGPSVDQAKAAIRTIRGTTTPAPQQSLNPNSKPFAQHEQDIKDDIGTQGMLKDAEAGTSPQQQAFNYVPVPGAGSMPADMNQSVQLRQNLPNLRQQADQIKKTLAQDEVKNRGTFDTIVSEITKHPEQYYEGEQLDYGKVLAEARKQAETYGGGDNIAQIIYNQAQNALQFQHNKPAADQEFKKLTGKTPKEYMGSMSGVAAEAAHAQSDYEGEVRHSQARINEQAQNLFDTKYKGQLEQFATMYPVNSPQFQQKLETVQASYGEDLRALQVQENARLKGVRESSARQWQSKIQEIQDKNQDYLDRFNQLYGQAYQNVMKGKQDAGGKALASLGPKDMGALFVQSLWSGLNNYAATRGSGLQAAGFGNPLTDWMQGRRTQAEANDAGPLDWSNPASMVASVGKGLGGTAPDLALLALTKNPTFAGLEMTLSSTLAGMGDVYNSKKAEGAGESEARQSAKDFAHENFITTLPLNMIMSSGLSSLLKGTGGAVLNIAQQAGTGVGAGLTQQYLEQSQSAGGKSLKDFLSEDAPKAAAENLLGLVTIGGLMHGVGSVSRAMADAGATSGVDQHYSDLIDKKGYRYAYAVAEMKYLNGILDRDGLAAEKAKIDNLVQIKSGLNDLGAHADLHKLYLDTTQDITKLKAQAESAPDEIMKGLLNAQVKEKENLAKDIVAGKAPYAKITTDSGLEIALPLDKAMNTLQNPDLQTDIAGGKAKVELFGKPEDLKDHQELLDNIQGKNLPVEQQIPGTAKITEVRHAETPEDDKGVTSGPTNIQLSAEGKEQAAQLAEDADGKGITRVVSSATPRGIQTAETVAKKLGVPAEQIEGLNAWKIGDFDKMPDDEFKRAEKFFVENPDATEFEGKKLEESFNQYKDRVIQARQQLEDENRGHTLLVNHGGNINIWDALNKNEGEWDEKTGKDYLKGKDTPPATLPGQPERMASTPAHKPKAEGLYARLASIEELQDPTDVVLQHFANGGKINPSAIGDLFGGKDERIRMNASTEGERKSRIGLLKKDAPGIDALAHQLWEANQTPEGENRFTTQDYRDAIEQVLQAHNSRASMAKELVGKHLDKHIDPNLTADAQAIEAGLRQKVISHLSGADEGVKSELEKILSKYQDQYGFIDWQKINDDSSGFDPDILNLSEDAQRQLYKLIDAQAAAPGESGNAGAEHRGENEEEAGATNSDAVLPRAEREVARDIEKLPGPDAAKLLLEEVKLQQHGPESNAGPVTDEPASGDQAAERVPSVRAGDDAKAGDRTNPDENEPHPAGSRAEGSVRQTGAAETAKPVPDESGTSAEDRTLADDLRKRLGKQDRLSDIPVGDKPHSTEQYLTKARAVLNQLFPDHTIKAYDTEAEYRAAEKRPAGSAGVYDPTGKYIAFNLERIRSGNENTIFHEVIHPIVHEALQSRPGAVDEAYTKLVDLKDVPGMEAVWAHEDLYRGRGLDTMKVEAITEFLTHVADGKIDVDKFSPSIKTRIIDAINKVFKALGINKVISTAQDIGRLASSIKEAFDKADAGAVKEALGKSSETEGGKMDAIKQAPTTQGLFGATKQTHLEDFVRDHIDTFKEPSIKKALVETGGMTDADAQALIEKVRNQRTLSAEDIIRNAQAVAKSASTANQVFLPRQAEQIKNAMIKTAKRWYYDGRDDVSDVKSIIRQNKGKEEYEINKLYHETKKLVNWWNTVPQEKQLAFILGMEKPELLNNQSQHVKDIADQYRQRLDKTYQLIKQAMPNLNFIEDYFPHFWKDPVKAATVFQQALAKAPLEGSKSFAKARFYDTIVEGMKNGLELQTTNPEEMVRLAEANAWKFQTARAIFDDMKKMGYLKFSTDSSLPKDWKGVDDKLFNRLGAYVNKDGEAQLAMGQYMMPPDVAKLMNDYLSLGIKGPVKTFVQQYNNIKNLFQLGVGLFHFGTTTLDSIVTGMTNGIQKISAGNPKGLVDLATLGNLPATLKRGFQAVRDYNTGKLTSDVQALMDANARVGKQKMYSIDAAYNMKKAFGQLRADSDFSKIPKVLWNGMLYLPEAINKPLMEHWVPALKVGGYLRSLDSEISVRKNMTPEELQTAKQKIWDSMDDRLGQVVYDNIFVKKSLKDLAFLTIRSAGWTGGTIRAVTGGVAEIPRSTGRLLQGQGLSQRTAYLAALPLTVGLMGAFYQYVMTGKGPSELKDYFFPQDGSTNPDGTDHRVDLPSYMKDILSYGKSPVTTFLHKTAPGLNEMVELYQNKDFYGEKIYNSDDPLYQKGLDVLKYEGQSMTPFSFKHDPNSDKPFADQFTTTQGLEQKFGIMPAPKERERSDLQNAIVQAYHDQEGTKEEGKTHAEMEQSIARRHLREFLYNGGTYEEASDELKDKAGISPRALPKFIHDAQTDPYEVYFQRLKTPAKLKLYNQMSDEDKEKYGKYIPVANREDNP